MSNQYTWESGYGNQPRQMKLKLTRPVFTVALQQNGASSWIFAYECMATHGIGSFKVTPCCSVIYF